MKNLYFTLMMILGFCCTSQIGLAQEAQQKKQEVAQQKVDQEEVRKEDVQKEAMIKAYPWTKGHFKNTAEPILSITEMTNEDGHTFVLVEDEKAKVLYDTDGNRYCTNSSELNCAAFYNLKSSDLMWKHM